MRISVGLKQPDCVVSVISDASGEFTSQKPSLITSVERELSTSLLASGVSSFSECLHYANMSVQYTAIFHGCKNDNFQMIFFKYFSYFCSKHRLWVHVRTASARRF